MPALDLEGLLQPVDDDTVTGPDLEADPAFVAAFLAAKGTPERQMGDSIVPAAEPDWREVRGLATDLLGRSRDLRVAVLLARALLRTDGIAGFADGLALVRRLIEDHWGPVHPRLDPDDANDPTLRVNVLLELASREATLEALRAVPLVHSRLLGRVSLRDIDVAEGRSPAPADVAPPDAAAIHAVFLDCDLDDLTATSAAAERAATEARGLVSALSLHVASGEMPDLSALTTLLATLGKVLGRYLAERGAGGGATAAEASPAAEAGSSAAVSTAALPAGAIGSREDVVRALDRICDYYSRTEPSSPVPLLLRRAQRLVNGSFVDIMRDLAPDALDQIERVCGLPRES